MSTTSWVYCFYCFKKIEKDRAIKDKAVYFCDLDCNRKFIKKIREEKEKEKEQEGEFL